MLENLIFRPVKKRDLNDIERLAKQAQFGLSTLPKDRALLKSKINCSLASFVSDKSTSLNGRYLFVLEECDSKKIVGTAGLNAVVGSVDPFYTFHLKKQLHDNDVSQTLLQVSTDDFSASECGTLYLDPAYREKGVGRFLSTARFLFVASHLEWFKSTFIAELRGVSDEQGRSPFWDHVMQAFFPMPFYEADLLSQHSKSFIAQALPEYPLCVETFHLEAQACIGQTHAFTKPAMALLIEEGFERTSTVDIFDAGPKVSVLTSDIGVIKRCQKIDKYDVTSSLSSWNLCGVSSGKGSQFQACCVPARVTQSGLSLQSCLPLKRLIKQDSLQRYYRLYPKSRSQSRQRVSSVNAVSEGHDHTFLSKFSRWYSDVSESSSSIKE